MIFRALNIVLIFSFVLLSFSSSVCYFSKLKSEQFTLLIEDIAEEEDETEKDSKQEADDYLDFNFVFSTFFSLEKANLSNINHWFLEFVLNKVNTPPPQQ